MVREYAYSLKFLGNTRIHWFCQVIASHIHRTEISVFCVMGHPFLVLLNIELLRRNYMHVAFLNIEPLGRDYMNVVI